MKKHILIDFLRRSLKSDLTCRDGEVDTFRRIPWLEPDSSNPDSNNPSASGTGKTATKHFLELSFTAYDGGIGFPPGSRLLTIHGEGAAATAIYLQPNNAIGARRLTEDGIARNIAFLPSSIGELRGAYPFGQKITLVGTNGMAWLLKDPSTSSYTLLTSLPEAPDVEFALDPVHLAGYTHMAEGYPEMDVAVDLHDLADLYEVQSLTDWLGEGKGLRVDEAVCRRVYQSVARAVGEYAAAVRAGGFYLTAVGCVASFGGALPSATVVADGGYTAPYARLLSWSLHEHTLHLRISFSLRPLQLTATILLTGLQKKWRDIFPEIRLHVTSEIPWTLGGAVGTSDLSPFVNGYTSLGASGEGFAFRFRAVSRASLLATARSMADFRTSGVVDITTMESSVLTLRPPSISAERYLPSYTDFLPVRPDGATLTDEGVILWRARTLLVPMPENGVVYRNRDEICDSEIMAVTQGGGRRPSEVGSRHPLFLFCSDGIRLLSSGSSGGYFNTRLISREVLRKGLVTPCADGAVFMSLAGLRMITFTGTLKKLSGDLPRIEASDDWVNLAYDAASGCVIAFGETIYGYSIDDEEWLTVESTSLPSQVSAINPDGKIIFISPQSSLTIMKVSIGERVESMEESEISVSFSGSVKCSLLTRPMKLGDAFSRKRVVGIKTVIPVDFLLEGSDDLTDWRILASGTTPICSLYPIACRFHRLTLSVDEELSGHLHRIRLTMLKQ
ncbi:MAG: hypothetical protein K2F87_03865 [Muribaculaceae bacterium]|nr:hypothetical protein [Muribaculaceae bacterium]